MLPRNTYSIKKQNKILTIHSILRPLLIHLTLDLQNLEKDVEQTAYQLQKGASLTYKQLPKSNHCHYLMVENRLHCLNSP